jgi:hypothetical protein
MVYLFFLLIRLYIWAVIWCLVIVVYLVWAMGYAVVFLVSAIYVAVSRTGSPRRLSPPPIPQPRRAAPPRRLAGRSPSSTAVVPPTTVPADADLGRPLRIASKEGRTLRVALVRHENVENGADEFVQSDPSTPARGSEDKTLLRTARLRREERSTRDGG